MSFSRSDGSAKKHMARVSDLYRERVRSIKTVLFFIMSVSLLSGETVPTTSYNAIQNAGFCRLVQVSYHEFKKKSRGSSFC